MSSTELKKSSLGLLGATTLGVVMLSPAMTLIGGFGPAFLNAEMAAPLAFLLGLLATLPTAVSYTILARDYPTSGSAATWAEMAFSKRVGVWAGWMVFLYYLTNFIIQPVTMGVFAGDLFQLADISPGFWTYALGVVICLIASAWLVYRGISISSQGALGFLLFESLVVVSLCVSLVYLASRHGVPLRFTGFQLSASPTGATGIFRAMVFAILAYCGFDVVTTLSEETKNPKVTIPRATILSLLVYAGVIIAGVWALSYGSSPEHLKQIANGGQMPITELAKIAWGKAGILISITAISASLGLAIATAIGASRVLFSMARNGLVPPRFAELNRKSVPHWALHLTFALALVTGLVTGIMVGPFQSYVWWGTTATFFGLVTYLLVNASNLVLNRKRAFQNVSGFAMFFVTPLIGIVFDAYLLYRTFFAELWAQGWATGQSVVVFDLLCCFAGLMAAIAYKRGSRAVSPILDLQ